MTQLDTGQVNSGGFMGARIPRGPRPEEGRLRVGINENGAILFSVVLLLVAAVLWAGRGPWSEQTDFATVYVGATILRAGESARLYDVQEQAAVRKSLFKSPSALLFEHPPFEALLFQPLASLPYHLAYILWALVNAAIWLSLPFLLRPYAPVPRDSLGYLGLWFLFAPFGFALYQGQSSFALLLFYALCFIQLRRGHALAAGACLGLGLFKFQLVLPFALIFLLRRQWRFLAGFALSGTFLGVLSLIAVGWRGTLNYAHFLTVAATAGAHSVAYGFAPDMGNMQGFLITLLSPYLRPGAISVLVAAGSLGLIGLTARRWRRAQPGTAGEDLMFAAGVAVSLAAGFHTQPHDLSPLALSLFLVAAYFPGSGRRALRYVLGTSLVLFWFPPLLLFLLVKQSVYLIFPVLLTLGLGTLKLASWMAAAPQPLWRSSTGPVRSSIDTISSENQIAG